MPLSLASPSDQIEFDAHNTRPRNIAELLVLGARLHSAHGVGLISTETEHEPRFISYPALLNDARRILGGLSSLDHPSGANVALVLEQPGDVIPVLWACIIGGYVPCPVAPIRNDPDRWSKHLTHVMNLLDQPVLVSSGQLIADLPSGVTAADLHDLRGAKPHNVSLEAQSRDPALLMLTSGSTGNSKAVVLTHGNLLASLAGRAARQDLTADDITLNWIAFDHVAALLESHMIALYVGATQLHCEPATVLSDPLLFLRLIDRHRVSVAFAPNFLLGQINAAVQSAASDSAANNPDFLDLRALRRIVTGGEANVVETGRRFLNLLEPRGLARNVLWPAFGMTETCAASVYSDEFPDVDLDREFASVGRPIEGMQIRIVDDHGAGVPEGRPGELQVHGPIVFTRYYNNDAATRNAFTEDGWFRTGDLGVVENGRLSLVGRSKDCIIVSGVNYFSHELEAALEQLGGVESSYVAAFPTRPKGADTEQLVVAFATTFSLDEEDESHRLMVAVRNATISLWGFRPVLILPLPKHAFPKTSLGKIQRSLMRKRLEAGEWTQWQAQLTDMTQRQLGGYAAPAGLEETAITQIFAEMFGLAPDTVSATASFFDLGGTSLEIIKLSQRLGKELGADDLPVSLILQNPSARSMAARIARGAAGGESEYDPVVPLQLTGSKTPLFCIHPAVGEVLVYVNLAKYFVNERPFFAIRARGFGQGEKFFSTLDEVVNTYVAAIRRYQPHGPYAIAGYSFGGIAALEIGKKLESQGETVAFLCSIDMPPYVTEPIGPDYCAISLAYFLSLITKERMLELLTQYRGDTPELCDCLVAWAPSERLQQLNLDLPKFKHWAVLTYSLGRIAKAYQPSGTVESVTVLFTRPQAGTKHDWLNGWVEVQHKRWEEFTRTAPRFVEVAGEHASLMDADHLSAFQATLRAEIDRALQGR